MYNSYADVLESYMIPAEEGLGPDFKALLITAGIFAPLIAAGAVINHKQQKELSKKQQEKYARELEKMRNKYSEYKTEYRNFGSISNFIDTYNNEITNKTWISTAKLPKATIVVSDIFENLQCAEILQKVYSKIEEFRKFANGNENGNNPHKDTLKKKLNPTIIIHDIGIDEIIFECDPNEGEFIAEVSNFSHKNTLLSKDVWDVSYSD